MGNSFEIIVNLSSIRGSSFCEARETRPAYDTDRGSCNITELRWSRNVRIKDRAEKRIYTPNPREARKAIEEYGAEVISLGYAGMAGLDERLKRKLGVPVIDGVAAAVKLMEAPVGCGIQTSKRRAYSPLEGKELVNMPEAFSVPYGQGGADR